jgi:hypothetical protein
MLVLRVLALAVAGAGALWFAWRFDRVRLPGEGESPLHGVDPGASVIVDLHPPGLAVGDMVIWRDGQQLRLGRVTEPPSGLTPEAERRIGEGWLWVEADRKSLPGVDSRLLGPVAPGAIAGRIVFVF